MPPEGRSTESSWIPSNGLEFPSGLEGLLISDKKVSFQLALMRQSVCRECLVAGVIFYIGGCLAINKLN